MQVSDLEIAEIVVASMSLAGMPLSHGFAHLLDETIRKRLEPRLLESQIAYALVLQAWILCVINSVIMLVFLGSENNMVRYAVGCMFLIAFFALVALFAMTGSKFKNLPSYRRFLYSSGPLIVVIMRAILF